MKNSEMDLIKNRIKKIPYGSVFVISDFTDVADYQNAKKCLLRLEKEGTIRRLIRGIYDKPYFSNLLKEFASPNIENVAQALARNYSWKISPSGLVALNLLGISTQVPNVYHYFSSGPYKTYTIGKIDIHFLHKSSKELLNLSYYTLLVVQAIKELGTNIDDSVISKIRSSLSEEQKAVLLR